MEKIKTFNVRIYGIHLSDKDEMLCTLETIQGRVYRKFPGGGLEFGEGIDDCLRREFLEELNLDVQIEELLFINRDQVISAFKPSEQVISVYYKVSPLTPISHSQIQPNTEEIDELEWLPPHKLLPELFPLSIDADFVRFWNQHFGD
jgi:8-oxo-dGTP pyrophosphatase MutT (NUDIX family)